MNPSDLIQAWAQQAQLPAGAVRADQGLCGFRAMDRFDVTLEWPAQAEDIFIFIDLLPTEGGELGLKRLREAMRLNAYGVRTRGAALGWDEDRDMLVLSHRVSPEGLGVETFGNLVLNLLDVAQQLVADLAFERDALMTRQSHAHAAKWFEPVRV